ncbi:FAD:protein FMN transferase [Amycolatopsis vastitatis]|uniref:FAD:protein FMN transferase n=1 Tax=Amycolatopsis vastitatis TaxID=1905142 RepID=A0A229SMQ7_9PSEU|nr:FAD:protein FMN transferase [Amycolatopsis vastitatis]OXM60307.1 thiamine biosynthesis protein [Amycolatopsis vastitatis]
MTAATAFRALGTTAEVLVTEPDRLDAAAELLHEELAAIDAACSRFRPDSEISRLHENAGRQVRVGPLLAEALGVALRAARLTGGLVDPTVGAAVRALGYDRDFAEVAADRSTAADPVTGRASRVIGEASRVIEGASCVIGGATRGLGGAVPVPGWHRVLFDPAQRLVVLPRGVYLDLGATAKALAADRAARRIHIATGCGTLVNLGGDLRAAGPAPSGGWQVALGDDHTRAVALPDATVALRGGGLASSGTTRRRWRHAGRTVHHIVDPRTGDIPEPRWRTVTVVAESTVDANAASTAAIVLGAAAPAWLERRQLPARLVGVRGDVVTTPGWPS